VTNRGSAEHGAIAAAAATLRALLADGSLDLSAFGAGRSSERLLALMQMSRTHSVSVGRLAEAHVDAVTILGEAGAPAHPGCLYGVWASSSPDGDPVIRGAAMSGTKRFCSGLGIIDRAVVAVHDHQGTSVVVDVDVRSTEPRLTHDVETWATPALGGTATGDVTFDGHPVSVDDIIGSTAWYLQRPGFWHGACGPAACWAGAAAGLVDTAHRLADDDPHRLAHVGAMLATSWSLRAMLGVAGNEIDAQPDHAALAQFTARSLRHLVERSCTDVSDRFSRAFGPRPFTTNSDIAQRFADLHLYLRQHHAERELGAIVACAPGVGGRR
jgi:hypothetical protein